MALRCLVAVAVDVGDGVCVGVLGGRVGVADGVIVGFNRLLPVLDNDIRCVGAGVYVGGTSDGSALVISGVTITAVGIVIAAAGRALVGNWTSEIHEINIKIPSRGKQFRSLIVPVEPSM